MNRSKSENQGKMVKKRAPKGELIFKVFRFKNLVGVSPSYYVSIFYAVVLLLTVYFLFLDQGLRVPQVRLRFHVLAGDASLYVNGKFYHNLNFSPDWESSTVVIPAGETELRIIKSGMKPWVWQQDFRANLWNNRWKPANYSFEVRIEAVQSQEEEHLWQEAWRGYLYRGLEAQKEISFDISHPYPWVLSEGLRTVLYSGENIPKYWSADLQRGLASTTSIYQWGDLLSGYSLVTQSAMGGTLGLLGPRSLAILARSAVKRLQRLEPGSKSLLSSWERSLKEKLPQAAEQADFWQQYRSQQLPEVASGLRPAARAIPRVALEFDSFSFMAISGQDFALQQTEVSNAQFARFWFSDAGLKLRTREQERGFASLVLYEEDQVIQPWGWSEYANLADILENPLLQDQPVRGVTWVEAQTFAIWMDGQLGSNEWELRLPRLTDHRRLILSLDLEREAILAENLGEETQVELDFQISQRPPNFTEQFGKFFGLKGLSGSLWEWHGDDYLPHPAESSANGNSDLLYKAVNGGSWLNTLPITEGIEDWWVGEFWEQDNELPVAADYSTVAGQFADIRSPYTGFRLLAQRK